MLPEDQEKIKTIRNWVISFNWDDALGSEGIRVTVQYPLVLKYHTFRSFEEAVDSMYGIVLRRAQREVTWVEKEREKR